MYINSDTFIGKIEVMWWKHFCKKLPVKLKIQEVENRFCRQSFCPFSKYKQ